MSTQLSGVSPHSCSELLGHAEDMEDVDNMSFLLVVSQLFLFIFPSPLKSRPTDSSENCCRKFFYFKNVHSCDLILFICLFSTVVLLSPTELYSITIKHFAMAPWKCLVYIPLKPPLFEFQMTCSIYLYSTTIQRMRHLCHHLLRCTCHFP